MAKKNKKTNYAPTRDENGKKLSRKERKQLRKSLLKSQRELEAQLVAEGKIPARNKYRAKSFFGRTMALVLVFLFGIVATVGAFLGFGAFAPVGDVLYMFGVDPYNVFYEEYALQSLFAIATDIIHNPFDSLEGIAKYSPAVDKYVDTLSASFAELGVNVNKAEFKATPFQNLGAYFKDEVIGGVVLGEALKISPSDSNRMMVAICYGNKGVDYTVDAEGNIVPITPPVTLGELSKDSKSVIDRVNVEDAFNVTAASNEAMRFLAFGTEGLNYEVNEAGQIEMLTNELTGLPFPKKTMADITSDGATPLENAKISDLVEITPETKGLLAAIKDWTTGDLKQNYRIERLKIGQVMTIDENSSLIAQAIKNWRLCDIKDKSKTDTLKLGQIITIDENSPPLLKALKETQVGELNLAVNDLRLIDVLKAEDFKDNNFLKSLKLTRLPDLGKDLKKLSARELFGAEMYSYLDKTENRNKGVFELYTDYKTGKDNEEGSKLIPKARTVAGDEEVRSYFVHGSDGTRLQRGFYTENGIKTAVPESKVRTKTVRDGDAETTEFYMDGEQILTPHYEWRYIDYANEPHLTTLPAGDEEHEGDEIGKASDAYGYTLKPGKEGSVPFLDENGEEWYYITTVTTAVEYITDPETGAKIPLEEKNRVAFRLLQDENGIYYTYLKFTPGGGADEFSEERVDLEREITSYTYDDGGETVTLEKNAAGKWAYMTGDEEPTEVVVTVYTHEEETKTEADPETGEETTVVTVPAYDYIRKEIKVQQGYYKESTFALLEAAEKTGGEETGEPVDLTISDVFGESDVTEKFEIVKTDGTGDPVEVERYLSGAWYFLFGGVDEEHGCFTDKSDMPVLDLTDIMGGMSEAVSHTPLWELYFHELLTDNPFVELKQAVSFGKKQVNNLNECTLTESIALVKQLVDAAP